MFLCSPPSTSAFTQMLFFLLKIRECYLCELVRSLCNQRIQGLAGSQQHHAQICVPSSFFRISWEGEVSLPGMTQAKEVKSPDMVVHQFLPSLLTQQHLQTLRSQGSNWEPLGTSCLRPEGDKYYLTIWPSLQVPMAVFSSFSFFNFLGNFSAGYRKWTPQSSSQAQILIKIFQHPPPVPCAIINYA